MTVLFLTRRQDHLLQSQQIIKLHPDQFNLLTELQKHSGSNKWDSLEYSGWYVIPHDIETRFVAPSEEGLLLSAFCLNDTLDQEVVLVIDNTSVNNLEVFTPDILKRSLFIAHNADFEAIWGCATGFLPERYACTMVNSKRLLSGQEGFKFDLISEINRRLGYKYIPVEMEKDIRHTFKDCTHFVDEQILYNAADTIRLKSLHYLQLEEAARLQQSFLHKTINSRIIIPIAQAEYRGIRHDSEKWIGIARTRKQKADEICQRLNDLVTNQYHVDLIKINPELRKKSESLSKRLLKGTERKIKLESQLLKFQENNKTHLKAYQLTLEALQKIENTTQESAVTDTGWINWGSQKQVLQLLKEINCPTPKSKDQKTRQLKPALGKEARALWFIDYPNHPATEFMINFDKYKKLIHNVNSFGEEWVKKYVNPINSRAYTVFKQANTDTGRFSSGDKNAGKFNIQQIPARDSHEYRECFLADPGRMLVTCDYSNAEGVIVIALSKDLSMKAITELKDQHSFLGQKAWRAVYEHRYNQTQDLKWKELSETYEMNKSTPEKELERNIFKNSGGLFPCLYGVAASKVAGASKISEPEAQVMIDTVKSLVPGAVSYLDSKTEEAIKYGYVIHNTRSGSRRWFTKILDHKLYGFPITKSEMVEIGMAGRNTAIQGTNSDAMKEAIAMVNIWSKLFKLDIDFCLTNHDEGVWSVPEENGQWYADKIAELMRRALQNYLIPEIQVKVDCKIGKSWTK